MLWLEPEQADSAASLYFSKLDAVRQAVNQAFFMGLEDLESHFAVYPQGAFYKKHLDRFSRRRRARADGGALSER
ncbi:hypothetical protein JOS77_19345 [Chromobacterium haemolyticum]|nr:hypothetical protein JOS77_19345 [Chromobacterium haemolyticum]